MAAPIYLDHNATTPVEPRVREAMLPWLGERFGNPSSAHAYGRAAAEAVDGARAAVAELIGARPAEIVFTSGGTESDNLALRGPMPARRRLVISAVEHPAVTEVAGVLAGEGWEVDRLPVTPSGVVDLEASHTIVAEAAGIVSVIAAQNETGVIQPVAEVAKAARAAASDVVVHCDAAQAVGKIPVDVTRLGVDLLTVVSHKLYGPCGVGALFVREGVRLRPLLHGGGQERGLRPGTPPVALLVGLGEACRVAAADLDREASRQRELRERLWSRLQAALPAVVRTAADVSTLPNTLHVRIDGRIGADVLAGAPEVAASTGSACHSDGTVSGALAAMGWTADEARGALRLTLGRSTTEADVDRAAEALSRAV